MKQISIEKSEKICESFLQGQKMNTIVRELKVSLPTVRRHLFLKGLRNIVPKTLNKFPKYKEIFPKDDKILGYVCGLIASDGNLQFNTFDIYLCAHPDDKGHMESISNLLIGQDITKYYKGSNTSTFKCALPKLYQYCTEMGITVSKSKNLEVVLEDKSEEFKWAFLRGVFDGDGTFSLGKTYGTSKISIASGSLKFVDNLIKHFGGKCSKTLQDNYNWYTYGKNLENILKYIPLEGPYCLYRKTEKFKILLKQLSSRFLLDNGKTRHKNSKIILYLGKEWILSELVRYFGVVSYSTALARVSIMGWDTVSAASLPLVPPKGPRPKFTQI